jgi:hypothetical protein
MAATACRISNSGEFVHAAPWSVAQQGSSNASHGCINLSSDNAKWFFYHVKRAMWSSIPTPEDLSSSHTMGSGSDRCHGGSGVSGNN